MRPPKKNKTPVSQHHYQLCGYLRETLVLSLPGALEDAVRRFLEESQKDNTDLIKRVQADIEIKQNHISLLRADVQLMSTPEIVKHIEALESELLGLQKREEELLKNSKISLPGAETLDLVRQSLKQHSQQLTWDMQEVKGQTIRSYVERIDIINDAFAVSFNITEPVQQASKIYHKNLVVEI